MTPYFLRLLPCTAGVGGTENEEYMKKIRPYLWRGGALVLAAALVVLLVLLGFFPQPILDTSHAAMSNIQQWFVNSVSTTRP